MKSITVSSEVAGTVWKVAIAVGDGVNAEQDLVILESMKMEIPSAAPQAGVVRQILVVEGEVVEEGQSLVVIECSE
jgi:acetyl-CoA carboxylase biotin carboxyl carrier protein